MEKGNTVKHRKQRSSSQHRANCSRCCPEDLSLTGKPLSAAPKHTPAHTSTLTQYFRDTRHRLWHTKEGIKHNLQKHKQNAYETNILILSRLPLHHIPNKAIYPKKLSVLGYIIGMEKECVSVKGRHTWKEVNTQENRFIFVPFSWKINKLFIN